MKTKRDEKFFVFQGVLSPDIDHLLSFYDEGLRILANKANDIVAKWLATLRKLQGIVITDFSISGYPTYARSVFSMNWRI